MAARARGRRGAHRNPAPRGAARAGRGGTRGMAGRGAWRAPGGGARTLLAGGQRFVTDFGTFVAPNISSDPEAGIGGWSDSDLADAVMRGVSPEGEHYYPAFPWTSYRALTAQDMADLIAHLRTLPADPTASAPHEVGFPLSIRRGIGLWKRLFLREGWVLAEAATPEIARGRYLVEGPGHCAECHTPRNVLGGPERDRWLAGGPNPEGEGRIPGLTPATLDWSAAQVAEYLRSGFTPDFDSAGGAMAEVVANTALLPDADRAAIAAYLGALPPVAPAP